jgi:hypothetical protein
MYFITCFSNYECEYLDNYRTFGYFGNYATCLKALNGNWCDMCEAGYYTYALVEKIEKGIHQHAKQIAWFCWDEEKEGFYETEKPEWSNG